MQLQPVFGKSILLAGLCSFLSGCAVTGPILCDSMDAAPIGSSCEDPCSPDWPAACMPEPFSEGPSPLRDCLARFPRHSERPEAPPYPRFHPLPTRPMFSPAPAAVLLAEGDASTVVETLP